MKTIQGLLVDYINTLSEKNPDTKNKIYIPPALIDTRVSKKYKSIIGTKKMIKWEDAKKSVPIEDKTIVFLDHKNNIFIGYYCAEDKMFFRSHAGCEYAVENVERWHYF